MSDHVTKPSHDDEATVGTPLHARQLSWMSHWIKTSSKPASMVNKSLLLSLKEENVDRKSLVHDGLVMEDDFPKSSEGASQDIEEIATRMTTEKGKISNTPFPTLSLCQNTENTSSLRTQTDHKKEDLVVRDFDLMPENDLRSNSCQKQKRIVVPHDQSNNTNDDASSPIVVFRRHFSNDNFTRLGGSHCKYQKLSMNKNFLPFLLKQQSEDTRGHSHTGLFSCQRSLSDIDQKKKYHGCRLLDRVPCSVRNVETMKICAMVDSVENSRDHHVLFTKETCVKSISEGCQVFREPPLPAHCKEKITDSSFSLSPDIGSSRPLGVMIQPLWTTSDSEKKGNTGNPSTSKVGSRNDSSLQADDTQIDVPTNGYIQLGMASSPLKKEDENISSREITRNKRPITEIPDINEELPGLQPAGSATDNTEQSTSRVHSLDAKQLFPCAKQTSRSESNAWENLPVCSETSNRWIKRLKLNSSDSYGVGTKSSDMGETSSHKKANLFFNKAVLSKHHVKEQMTSNESLTSSMSSKKRNQRILGCSWIQRWRQRPVVRDDHDPEPLLICEPHSLKLGVDELGKKQFPSIAAMALMGKAMNGFRPCEFRKRGSIVVWNTKEY